MSIVRFLYGLVKYIVNVDVAILTRACGGISRNSRGDGSANSANGVSSTVQVTTSWRTRTKAVDRSSRRDSITLGDHRSNDSFGGNSCLNILCRHNCRNKVRRSSHSVRHIDDLRLSGHCRCRRHNKRSCRRISCFRHHRSDESGRSSGSARCHCLLEERDTVFARRRSIRFRIGGNNSSEAIIAIAGCTSNGIRSSQSKRQLGKV